MQLLNLETPPSLRIHSGCHQGRGYLSVWTLAGSQCGRSSTLELPHMGITAKLGEVWAPAFKPFDLVS